MKLRILADDLTGALDSAAAFGAGVPVDLDVPSAGDDDAVTVVATATRDVPAASLPALLAPSLPWLCAADLAFKKVDSLLRGNTFAECTFVAQGFTRVVFAPAYPAQGRFLIGGRAYREQPGQRTREAIEPRTMRDAFTALGRPELWVPDVRDDADLAAVAATSRLPAARTWLWCGSAGLAQALAAEHGLRSTRVDVAPVQGSVLLLSASFQPVIKRQWAALRSAGALDRSDVTALDLSPAERVTPDAAAELLAQRLAQIAAGHARPAALLVVGGDTLRALCRAVGTTRIVTGTPLRAGWGCARLVGGRWDGVVCHSRSGAFGADDDLVAMLAAVRAPTHA